MDAITEKEFIGVLLAHPELIETAQGYVSPDMLNAPILRDTYACMLQGVTNVVDLERALSPTYGTDICTLMGTAIHDYHENSFEAYIKAVRSAYRTREIKRIFATKDINSATVNDLLPQIIEELENVLPVERKKAKSLADMVELKDRYFKPKEKGFELGFKELDHKINGIDKGDVCIIAARPAVGKSAFALQVMKHNKHLKGGYFNLEMGEQQIYERSIAAMSGINLGHLRQAEHFNNDEEYYFNKANEALAEYDNIKIITQYAKLSDIRSACAIEKFDYIIIDYLQLIEPDNHRGANRTAEVGDISRGLKKIAKDYDIPVIALSQLNRRSEGTEDKEPTMADLRESGAIEQDASVIVIMWNVKDEPNMRNVKVDKARNGMLGRLQLYFNGAYMLFSETPIPEHYRPIKKDDDGFIALPENTDSPFT